MFGGLIDRIAVERSTEEVVLIDYKSATWPWKKKLDIYPKAQSFQAPIYLIQPDKSVLQKLNLPYWPSELHFLVAPEKGQPVIVRRGVGHGDYKELDSAVQRIIKEKDWSPRRGFQCSYCPFFEKCNGLPGERNLYVKRKIRDYASEED